MPLGPEYHKISVILAKYVFNKTLIENATPESHIIKDLKINSARIVDIILDIEDDFKIEIDNKALKKIQTVADLSKLVQELAKTED